MTNIALRIRQREDPAQLIGMLMDALSADLEQLRDQPSSGEELIAQIRRLTLLIRAIKNGEDLTLQHR